MREFRGLVAGLIVAGIFLGTAGAGTGIDVPRPPAVDLPGAAPEARSGAASAAAAADLEAGRFLVGSAKRSIAPDPARWVPDVPQGRCGSTGSVAGDPLPADEGCLLTFDGRYAKSVRSNGVYARATAISNGNQTVILAVLDVVGWFRYYPQDVCGDCGSAAIAAAVGSELGIPASNIVLASTHTHASANTLGLVPSWYYEQVRDIVKETMRAAYTDRREAVIDVGVTTSRWNNADRRIVTRAVPDYEVQWLRATATDGSPITVVYNYAAHPTVLTSNDTLHSGFAGYASDRLEGSLGGGVAMFFASGLGNQTVVRSRGVDGLGHRLADTVLRDMQESPRRLTSNAIGANVRDIAIPGDNMFLLGARAANVFVRDILPPAGGGPLAGRWGKNSRIPSCAGAGPVSVNTTIGGFKIGEAAIMIAPGEIFSTISLVTKDYLENAEVVFVLGLANDQLGYIIPYEEFDETAHQGPGIAANSTDTSQYEEVLSLGRCAGEQVMDELIASGRALGLVP